MSSATSMTCYSYVGEVNTNLICCVCQCPFQNPVVTMTCSHTFCRGCIEQSLEQSSCCPVDRSQLSLDDLKPENLLLRNMVDELLVECTHRSSGCKTTCQRQLLDAHLRDSCQYVQVPCSEEGCGRTVLRRDIGMHRHDCTHRLVNCVGCGATVTASELETHEAKCVEQDVKCVACSEVYRRGEIVEHIANCPEVEVNCMHSAQGCTWIGIRKLLETHISECPFEAIKGFFAINDARLTELRDENTVLKQRLGRAEASVHTLSRELGIARRALGPWWRSGDTPCIVSDNLAEPSTASHSNNGSIDQNRWRSPNPLSPILNFSPEASPISPANEVDSVVTTNPAPSFSDPAFLAPYFPSNITQSSDGAGNVAPQATQVDPMARHLFPFSSRHAFPPAPIRFPDLTHPNQSVNASASISALPRVPPIDRNTSLEGALSGLRGSVAAVSGGLDTLARRTDVALTTENLRMNEEVGALRAIVHGLRMQVHALITERNGTAWGATTTTTTYYNHPPPPPNPPLVINSVTQTTKL